MSLKRSEARIIAMTILYQINLCEKNKINYDKEEIISNNLEVDNEFVRLLVNGVIDNLLEIDNLANKYLGTWPINRLGINDQAIFRLAIYELKYMDTPKIVAINEAIELANMYSDEKISKMLNGVLDNIYHNEVDSE